MTWSREQKLSYLSRLPWTVTVDRDDDGDLVAAVAELPFIIATGTDARAVARDVYEAVWTALDAMLSHQDRIPLPPDSELPWESGVAPTPPMTERYEGEADALRQRIIELVAEREVWQTRISQLERIVKETTAAKELIAELRRRTESAEQRVQVHKDFLTSDEAATYMRVSKQTLAKLRCERKSPPYRKVGGRVLYERTELEKWMDMPRRGNYA